MPQPDAFQMPSVSAISMLVSAYLRKMNCHASPGFDRVAAPFLKNAVKLVPKESGRGTDRVNVLLPLISQLFHLMLDKACIPDCWKSAKITPLHKKGQVLDPGNYRMLAVSGTMYRLYTNVLREVVTDWCRDKSKIPDTQFGFYPGRNTLQPMFILRHLRHAAQALKPNSSSRLMVAFIDFKQAYDTIPRDKLWEHFQRICMPAHILSVIKNLYENDEYVLVDGLKRATVSPTRGVKQGCPLSPLLFALYINDIDRLADGVEGAVTGSPGVRVTHLLYADDLGLTTNKPEQMQCMLNRLRSYADRKGLTVNVGKSEVVHFNAGARSRLHVFNYGGEQLINTDSFKYLGMLFTSKGSMTAAAERVVPTFHAGCLRVKQFAGEHGLIDRPHTFLWLAKTYVIPASMYASQIWGTRYMKQGAEMECPLQTGHLCFLKRVLGVKRTTCNWSVLRECGQEPLQFYWFRAAIRFYNALLSCNSRTVRKVLEADRELSKKPGVKCWTSDILAAFGGLQNCEQYEEAVRRGTGISVKEFAVDLRARLCQTWSVLDGAEPRNHDHKRASYHRWFASPVGPMTSDAAPFKVPRYLNLDLSRHVQRNISRFRLRAHRLGVERACWQTGSSGHCDFCDRNDLQDEKHAIFLCKCDRVGALRSKFAHLFFEISPQTRVSLGSSGFYYSEVSNADVHVFLRDDSNQMQFFLSELMDSFSEAEQSNYLAEGQNPM